jgi:mRNA interferase MazF
VVVSQGEIWWADLADPVGSAPGYRRPVLIIQCDAFNHSRIATVVCVVLTGNVKWANAPGNVLLTSKATGLDRDSVANVSLIVTVDRAQLTECVGKIAQRQLDTVFAGIDIIFGR